MTSTHGRVLCVVHVVIVALLIVAYAYAAPSDPPAGGRHIVIFQHWMSDDSQQDRVVSAQGGFVVQRLGLVNGAAVILPPGVEKQLARSPEVLRVDVDAEVYALGKPASPPGQSKKDSQEPEQPDEVLPWGVDRIDAEYAWSATRGAGVSVAVLDTGIDADHPDLQANIAGGVNFVSNPPWKPAVPTKWDDDNGHGTHCAGIIAGVDNDIGVVGVAPEATLYAVKVLNKNGSGYISQIIAGLEWCVDNDIDIASMSLGTDSDVLSFHEACDAAAAAGVILVAAAGNDGADVDYPGAYSSVIAVAATNSDDAVASWSSRGTEVDIAAAGAAVYSTWKGGGYDTKSGTSMATPHVTGTLALALAAGRTLNLCASADDLPPAGTDIYSGCGLLDAGEAATGVVNYGDDLP